MAAPSDSWFVRFGSKSLARARLFCFHHGGGGASSFRNWPGSLPDFTEVIGVQLPGRETRYAEPPIANLETIVQCVAERIVPYIDLPCIFFGYSVGALIAHHVAARLLGRGRRQPAHLIVAGRPAPRDENVYYENIAHLPDSEFLTRLRDFEGTPDEFVQNAELTRIYLPILRSDFAISEAPVPPCPALTCPITVFGGTNDRIPEERMRLWCQETTAQCDVHMFPGSHFFVREQEIAVVAAIGELLRARYAYVEKRLWL